MTEINLTAHLVGFVAIIGSFLLMFNLLMSQIHRLRAQKKALTTELAQLTQERTELFEALQGNGGGLLKRRYDNLRVATTLVNCVPEFLSSDTSDAMQVRCNLTAHEQFMAGLFQVPFIYAELEKAEHINNKAPEIKQQRAVFWDQFGRHVPLPPSVE